MWRITITHNDGVIQSETFSNKNASLVMAWVRLAAWGRLCLATADNIAHYSFSKIP